MKLLIHSTALIRNPRYPYIAQLDQVWETLKIDIFHASSTFHDQIKDVPAEEIDALPLKTRFTIWKYFNRSKYRCTPFGTFATIGIQQFTVNSKATELLISDQIELKRFAEWSQTENLVADGTRIEKLDLNLFSNSSYYFLRDRIRFIAFCDEKYELSEIEFSEPIAFILKNCAKKIRYIELENLMLKDGYEVKNLHKLLVELIDVQLLLTEQSRNIIGQDYFKRLSINDAGKQYVLAIRKIRKANLNLKVAKDLLEMTDHLHHLIPVDPNKTLQDFTTSFVDKFNQAELPLLFVLDPETGIGYAGLESQSEQHELIPKLHASKKSNLTDNTFQQGVQAQFHHCNAGQPETIQIENFKSIIGKEPAPLPNSLTLLFTTIGNNIVIDNIGGCTANAVNGRFSLAGTEFEGLNRSIGEMESEANPDVLIFDIGYTAEPEVDNINRRADVYSRSLNILNYDTSDDPVLINDLLISVRNNQVVLRSKTLGKRMVPRMSSAYNHHRSNLALFRFLCDLQHQGLQSQLLPDIRSMLPNQKYFPRLQYKNIILSRRMWLLEWEPQFKSSEVLLSSLANRRIPKHIEAGNADQYLRFDLDQPDEFEYFKLHCTRTNEICLREVFSRQQSDIKDENGQPYVAQWQLSLHHTSKLYEGANVGPPADHSFPQRTEWIYYLIYGHEKRQDQLLIDTIKPFLILNKKLIKRWFFIRYFEHGSHLRLRLQLKRPEYSATMNAQLTSLLQEDLQAGLVTELSTKIYVPERARYGAELISAIEQHFYLDSEYVLRLVKQNLTTDVKYQLVHLFINCLADVTFLPEAKLTWIETILRSFEAELQTGPEQYRILNANYKKFSLLPLPRINTATQRHLDKLSSSMSSLISKTSKKRKKTLFADLTHMHVNRLFASDQRHHEMICYYYFFKQLRSK